MTLTAARDRHRCSRACRRARTRASSPTSHGAADECIEAVHDFPATRTVAAARSSIAAWETSPHIKEEEFTRALSARPVRLPAQEPLARLRRLAERRGRFARRRVPGRADGASSASPSSAWTASATSSATSPACVSATSARELVGRLLDLRLSVDAQQLARSRATPPRRSPRRSAPRFRVRRRSRWSQDYIVARWPARSAASSTGRPTTSRCRTSRRACARRASGCSPICDNALLLATSNRSEAAVGYATMDGDTSGGLSPIAGIDKAFLRRWLAGWRRRARRASARFRRLRPSTRRRRPPSCGPPAANRPTKTT